MISILKNIIRKFLRPSFIVIQNTVRGYNRDKIWHMGASIAYYTIFSLPAILIIVIAIVGFLLGEAAVEGRVYSTLVESVGEKPALQIQDAVKNIGSPTTNWWMTILGFGFLVFIATNIFNAMQSTFNRIFSVVQTDQKISFLQMIINRFLSFGMVLSIGALLIFSILLNGFLFALTNYIQANKSWMLVHFPKNMAPYITYLSDNFLVFLNQGVSLALVTVFFTLLYKILPAVKLRWRFILAGAFFASVLFWIGQLLIGYYLQKAGVINAYGAAGSLIAILIWVYYSAQLVFIGAEFIRSLCQYRGVVIRPKSFARASKRSVQRVNKIRLKDENGKMIDIYESVST
jgi:membrane protein